MNQQWDVPTAFMAVLAVTLVLLVVSGPAAAVAFPIVVLFGAWLRRRERRR